MLQEELPASSRGADQVYFSMLMVNDPNAALFGSLRPARVHPVVAALRRPFETAPQPAPVALEATPALRPRWSRWMAAGLLLLGIGGAEVTLETLTRDATVRAEPALVSRHGATTVETTTPALHPAKASSERPVPVADTAVLASTAPAGLARAHTDTAATLGVTGVGAERTTAPAAAARATTSVKKKAAARQRQRAFGRALTTRRNAR